MVFKFKSNCLKIVMVRQGDANAELKRTIALLKNEHWSYPLEEHLRWLDCNLLEDDLHVLIQNDSGDVLAYMNLVKLNYVASAESKMLLGVGNVCVQRSYLGMGLGSLIMYAVGFYLKCENMGGILLCKDTLTRFYQECGWMEYPGQLYIANKLFEQKVLLFNTNVSESEMRIARRF